MAESGFSGQHRARFQELLAMRVDLYAINSHEEKLDFGPWSVCCDLGDSDTKARLKTRFRAAAREAATAAGASSRANLQNWWISKLARGRRRPYIQGLIQRSIEYCEELESNAAELRPLVGEENPAPGLSRDRYPGDHPIPYWLYDKPHRALADAAEEFSFWDKHIWQGFDAAVEQLASGRRIKRHWVDETGNQHREATEETRRRLRDQVENRTRLLDAWILGVSYDVAVLQANYILDRGLRGAAAMRAFEEESTELAGKVKLAWQRSSKRLGLSWRKQEQKGIELDKPFRDVKADLSFFLGVTNHRQKISNRIVNVASASEDIDPPATPEANMPVPPTFVLSILRDRLNREQISPEDAWKQLLSIADDPRYPKELRLSISNELHHLSDQPIDVTEPALEALRAMLTHSSPQIRREAVTMLINRILDPQEIKDYEAADRHAQRVSRLAESSCDQAEVAQREEELSGGASAPPAEAGQQPQPASPIEIHVVGIPSQRNIPVPFITQQMKFFEKRHTFPNTSEEIKADFRGLARAAIVAVTRGSSVRLAQVDDWMDWLLQYKYSWETMEQLVSASMDHLVDLHRHHLAVGTLEQAARLDLLANKFGELLTRLSASTLASDPKVVTSQNTPPLADGTLTAGNAPANPGRQDDDPTATVSKLATESASDQIATPSRAQSEKGIAGGGDSAPAGGDGSIDFSSEAVRSDAMAAYIKRWTTGSWTCSEASLARTARVDRADLSRWKKDLLPAGSDKKRRIEKALKDNEPPTPPAGRKAEA